MSAQVTEIAAGIFRLSVFVPEIGPSQGFTFMFTLPSHATLRGTSWRTCIDPFRSGR
jgi:hypothetical protein